MKNLREKIFTAVVGVLLTAAYFLIGNYFNNFVTKADFGIIEVIKLDLKHLKEGQNEIKEILKNTKKP
jgi:hypothetical protein